MFQSRSGDLRRGNRRGQLGTADELSRQRAAIPIHHRFRNEACAIYRESELRSARRRSVGHERQVDERYRGLRVTQRRYKAQQNRTEEFRACVLILFPPYFLLASDSAAYQLLPGRRRLPMNQWDDHQMLSDRAGACND